jgi:hypothetical protein
MPDDEIDLLRSVFALAHEKRESFSLRIVQAVKDAFRPRKTVIETLDLMEKVRSDLQSSPRE